jgi:hypothetical protein
MKVNYLPSAEQWGEGKLLIDQATQRLEDILGQSSGQVTATWERVEDSRGRTLHRLKLKDFTGEVSADFAPDELRNAAHMHVRLYRLWGDLLRIRNNQVHNSAIAISGQISGVGEIE